MTRRITPGEHKHIVKLVRKLQQGDSAAFLALYDFSSPCVFSLVYARLDDPTEAHEITSATFATVFEKIDSLRDAHTFCSWVETIAKTKCAAVLRDRYKHREHVNVHVAIEDLLNDYQELDENFLPEEALDALERDRFVRAALDALPPAQHEAIRLYYRDDLSTSEMAQRCDTSVGTICKRLYDARNSLRSFFDKSGYLPHGTCHEELDPVCGDGSPTDKGDHTAGPLPFSPGGSAIPPPQADVMRG